MPRSARIAATSRSSSSPSIRPVIQWPRAQLAASDHTLVKSGKAGKGRASQAQTKMSSAAIIRPP